MWAEPAADGVSGLRHAMRPIAAFGSGNCCSLKQTKPAVGASLLAKDVNDNRGLLSKHRDLGLFASKLAPTVVLK